jgi:hypothetical protein
MMYRLDLLVEGFRYHRTQSLAKMPLTAEGGGIGLL